MDPGHVLFLGARVVAVLTWASVAFGGPRACAAMNRIDEIGGVAELSLADIAPAKIVEVKGEEARLSSEAPKSWSAGTKLRQLQTLAPGSGTPAPGAVVASSVVVRHGGRVLEKGKDWLLDPAWGSVGLAPGSSVTTRDAVSIDYAYSLRRLDSRVRTADGREVVRRGEDHLTVPQPPRLGPGETRVANVFVDYHSDGRGAEPFPVLEGAARAKTGSTPGRVPRAMDTLRSGGSLKIVCWGDSVTVGGDASSPEMRYAAVFERRLREKFPAAKITVGVVAVGGSNSRQWLWPEKFPRAKPGECDWAKVAAEKPDLVTLEFVNDAGLSAADVDRVYGEILSRVRALGAELILITPHFTMPSMMGFASLREPERRPYVLALREFAAKNGLALADASARWEHLWKEGLPYVTLLRNGINHPDDRGHALFADELMRCFE